MVELLDSQLQMNKRAQMLRMNQFLGEIRHSNRCGSHVNCFRGTYHSDKVDDHEDMKYLVYKTLRRWGHDVIVEPIFNNGKRADVIDLTDGIIYEVTYSETVQELQEKVKSYPECFEIRRVDAKKLSEFKEEMLL